MTELLAALGSPERRYATVLVGGTNGKGSTAALLAAMLAAAGYRTGLYTSPHLERPAERIRIDGRSIEDERLVSLLARVLACEPRGDLPTYFEAMTAAAFLAFAREEIEIAVVEVGMGGRLDATNLCDPLLSIVTSIDFEHEEFLGTTLAAIAGEKAGIFRRGRPAIVWAEQPAALAALAAAAAGVGADFRAAGDAVVRLAVASESRGQRVTFSTATRTWQLALRLPGAHQANNLVLAVLAAEELAKRGYPRLDPESIARGVAGCEWPGRLELVTLPHRRQVLLDAAHNPAGAERLAAYLHGPALPFTLLFGALADKDVGSMLTSLAPQAASVVLTRPPNPRAVPPAELARYLLPALPVSWHDDPDEALMTALGAAPPLVVACGSIYLIGELRGALRRRFGVPPPPR